MYVRPPLPLSSIISKHFLKQKRRVGKRFLKLFDRKASIIASSSSRQLAKKPGVPNQEYILFPISEWN